MNRPLRKPFRVLLVLVTLALPIFAAPLSQEIMVAVGGVSLELHNFKQGTFGLFELSQAVDVEIRTPFDVRWVNVRPRSAQVKAQIGGDHQTIRFQMKTAMPLTIEFNDDLEKVVHLFPYLPENNPAHDGDPEVKFFGPGVHQAGLIDLKSGETLYLAPGAWVKGIVRSLETKNITIRGRGVLDGSDVPAGEDAPPNSDPAAASTAPLYTYGTGDRNMIYLNRTEGAKIEGITIFNSSHWTLYARRTQHTHIDGIRILNSSEQYGNDGIDLVSSSDALVENIFVRTNDDCVAVKNLDDVEMHDITIRNAVLWNMPTGGNGLEVGFELGRHRVSKILFQNVDLIHVQRGSAISIHNGDAATLEDVTFDNIRIEDVRRKLIDFGILYAQYGFDRAPTQAERTERMDRGGVWDGAQRFTPDEKVERAKFRGHVRNVTVRNLQVVEGSLPYSLVIGFDPDHAIENVRIEGLTYLGRALVTQEMAKLTVENAPGFILK